MPISLAAWVVALVLAATTARPPAPPPVAKAVPVVPDTSPGHGKTRGWATWYARAAGGAAAGPVVRRAIGKHWRGSRVQVCSGGRCIVVVLDDWCACGSRHGKPTLLDLSRADFARLSSPSAGVLSVTVNTGY